MFKSRDEFVIDAKVAREVTMAPKINRGLAVAQRPASVREIASTVLQKVNPSGGVNNVIWFVTGYRL